MLGGRNQIIVKYFMEKFYLRFPGGSTYFTSENLQGQGILFEARFKFKIITGYRKDILKRVSYICDIYVFSGPTFTEYWYGLITPPLSLSPKSHH